jgi:hypothetical protein
VCCNGPEASLRNSLRIHTALWRAASLCSASSSCLCESDCFSSRRGMTSASAIMQYIYLSLSLNAYDPQLTLAGRGPELNMRLNMVIAWHFFFWLLLDVRTCLYSKLVITHFISQHFRYYLWLSYPLTQQLSH